MTRRPLTIALALALLAGGPARADEKETPATAPAEELAGLIRQIAAADHPRAAIALYARASAIDRRSAELHHTQMTRMLRFGLPDVAYYPARVLTRLQGDDGQAWAVVGYRLGKSGQLGDALEATVRAATRKKEPAPSVMNNLGQLMAWYERQFRLPRLSPAVRRAMERHQDTWAEHKQFARAYRRMNEAYKQSGQFAEDIAGRAAQARQQVRDAEQRALEINAQTRQLADEIDQRQARIQQLRISRTYGTVIRPYPYGPVYEEDVEYGGGVIISGRGGYVRYGRVYRTYPYDTGHRIYPAGWRRYVDEQIRQEQRAIDGLQQSRRALRILGTRTVRELKDAQATLDELDRDEDVLQQRPRDFFRWDPPAVGGVVYEAVDRVPLPEEDQGPAEVPMTAEQKARRRLALGQTYLANGLATRGRLILEEVVDRFPRTRAAAEAQTLIDRQRQEAAASE